MSLRSDLTETFRMLRSATAPPPRWFSLLALVWLSAETAMLAAAGIGWVDWPSATFFLFSILGGAVCVGALCLLWSRLGQDRPRPPASRTLIAALQLTRPWLAAGACGLLAATINVIVFAAIGKTGLTDSAIIWLAFVGFCFLLYLARLAVCLVRQVRRQRRQAEPVSRN